MAQARQAERTVPQTPMFLAAAALAAVFAAIVLLSTLNPFGLLASGEDPIGVSPAVIEAGRQWEAQTRQQIGHVDPAIESGRQWELERKQQSGAFD